MENKQKKHRLSLFIAELGETRETFLKRFKTNTDEVIDSKQLQRWNKKPPKKSTREKLYDALRQAEFLDPIRLIAQRGFSIEELVDGIWKPEIDEEEWLSALKRSKPQSRERLAAFVEVLAVACREEWDRKRHLLPDNVELCKQYFGGETDGEPLLARLEAGEWAGFIGADNWSNIAPRIQRIRDEGVLRIVNEALAVRFEGQLNTIISKRAGPDEPKSRWAKSFEMNF